MLCVKYFFSFSRSYNFGDVFYIWTNMVIFLWSTTLYGYMLMVLISCDIYWHNQYISIADGRELKGMGMGFPWNALWQCWISRNSPDSDLMGVGTHTWTWYHMHGICWYKVSKSFQSWLHWVFWYVVPFSYSSCLRCGVTNSTIGLQQKKWV
jgi:hypothetical protein